MNTKKNILIAFIVLVTFKSYSQNFEGFKLQENGNVGVGTLEIPYRLTVAGAVSSFLDANNYSYLQTNGDGNSYINFNGNFSTRRLSFQLNGSTKMSILPDGRVGINSVNPVTRFAVVGGISTVWNGSRYGTFLANSDGNLYINYIGAASTNRIGFQINGSSKISIYNDRMLFHDGVDLILNGNEFTPDYVFSENYDLMTIEEQGVFIKSNRHLPSLSSAQKIEDDKGYSVRDRFVQMIEELEKAHIYIQQLNEKIEHLNEENKKISNKLQDVQKKLNNKL